jgi:phage antirepressor YoqD-like protein
MQLSTSVNKTMTSREIAELTGKELSHVHRDIREMLAELEKDDPKLDHPKTDADARGYVTCFYLDRELTDTLLTSYSVVARNRVIKRWHELETKQVALPNYADALRQLADKIEVNQQQQALIEQQAPKVAALDRISVADGEVNLQTAGRILQQRPNKFIEWLTNTQKWIHKRPGTKTNLPYSHIKDAGYLTVKNTVLILPDQSERINAQTMVTAKGIAKLAMILGVSHQDGSESYHG